MSDQDTSGPSKGPWFKKLATVAGAIGKVAAATAKASLASYDSTQSTLKVSALALGALGQGISARSKGLMAKDVSLSLRGGALVVSAKHRLTGIGTELSITSAAIKVTPGSYVIVLELTEESARHADEGLVSVALTTLGALLGLGWSPKNGLKDLSLDGNMLFAVGQWPANSWLLSLLRQHDRLSHEPVIPISIEGFWLLVDCSQVVPPGTIINAQAIVSAVIDTPSQTP